MAKVRTAEIGTTDLRAQQADVLNKAAVYGEITYVTSRGRRIAAIVPVLVADEYIAAHRDEVSESPRSSA